MSDLSVTGGASPRATIHNDLLIGAKAISFYLYGTEDKYRSIYHLARTSRMPHSYMGSKLCARRSELDDWLRSKK